MKNKILIPIALITSFNISQAEYSAKIFIDGLSFKNEIQTPVIPPSTNCVYDVDLGTGAMRNISDSTNGMGIVMGETVAYYNGQLIGVDSATKDFPAGLSLGQVVDTVPDYASYEICADDFSIYEPPAPPAIIYTYNDVTIPNGSIGTTVNNKGNNVIGFSKAAPASPYQSYGTPIPNGTGHSLMLEIYEYEPPYKRPMAIVYIVKGNEGINETSDPGNIADWWSQYDHITLSNNDESFKIEIPIYDSGAWNWKRTYESISNEDYLIIENNPNIITKIKFRNKQ